MFHARIQITRLFRHQGDIAVLVSIATTISVYLHAGIDLSTPDV